MYATTIVSCIYSLVFPKMNKTRKKDWKIRKVRAWWPGDTHPHDQSLQPSTHITHWNWSSANGADTCGHRKGRPERRRPPGLPGGEGERTKPPSRGSCAFCWGGGRSLWGSHTQFRAMLGLWALQREDGGRDGARGVHSASPTPSLSSQLKAKPAPPPRPFPQSKRLTSRSRPALSSRKDAAQRPAGNVVHRERERLVHRSGVRKRGRAVRGWRPLGVILDQLEGLGGSAALSPKPMPQTSLTGLEVVLLPYQG